MKRGLHKVSLSAVALIFLIASFAACTNNGNNAVSENEQTRMSAETAKTPAPSTVSVGDTVPFAARYVRTSLRGDDYAGGDIAVIRSLNELYAYYDDNKYIFYLRSFADAAGVYDAAFFEGNALVVTTIYEPSGSIRHRVTGVFAQDDTLEIDIDRLLPGEGTADMAMWHILIEVPQESLDDRQIGVAFRDVDSDLFEIRAYNFPQLTSRGRSVQLYEAVITSVTYDPETGEQTAVESSFSLAELKSYIPELIVGDTLVPGDYWIQVDDITLWDEDFNVLDEPEELSAEMLYAYGPGTYYAGYKGTINMAYIEKAEAYNQNTSVFFAALTVPESTTGLAGQLTELGSFAWGDVTHVSVDTRADGESVTMYANADGIIRLMSQFCTTPEVPAQMTDGMPDAAQVMTLAGESVDLVRVIWTGEYLWLDTGGLLFTLDAPPWLFGALTESALGSLMISQPEAEALAQDDLAARPEMSGAVPVSAQVTGTERYGWDIVCDTEEGPVRISIEEDFVTRVQRLDEKRIVTKGPLTDNEASSYDVIVIVSNQSFDVPKIHMTGAINDTIVFDDEFQVGNQHEYSYYYVDIDTGEYPFVINAKEITVNKTLRIYKKEPLWIYITYWNSENEGEHIDVLVQNEQLGLD